MTLVESDYWESPRAALIFSTGAADIVVRQGLFEVPLVLIFEMWLQLSHCRKRNTFDAKRTDITR